MRDYLRRAQDAGIEGWAAVEALSEAELERRLFGKTGIELGLRSAHTTRALPDWRRIHEERARPGVTLRLLWEEYAAETPTGLKYSRFAELYRIWSRKLSLVMRQEHTAGEKGFVDYCDGLF